MSRADRFYIVLTLFLLITAMAGGIMLAVQHSRSQPVEIVISQTEPPVQIGEVYIGGTVVNPGIYSIMEGDTLQALLSDAGIDPDADLSGIQIYVPRKNAEQPSQKIDINRAEPWLLEALPGIGEVIAQRIVDYRTENGPFRTIEDLLKVSGIGQATFEKIKYYITVSD